MYFSAMIEPFCPENLTLQFDIKYGQLDFPALP